MIEGQPVYDRASQLLNVLVVDDDVEDVEYLRRLLRRSGCSYQLLEANTVEQGLEALHQKPDVILLDYFIGEGTGLDFLTQLSAAPHQPPVILLTGADDGELDHCVFSGFVADYLPKNNMDAGMLMRSLHYAHRDAMRVQQLEFMAHYDPLTGLCNRRLFMDRLDHAFETAKRNQITGALLYIDIDGFKQINDELGHDCGDELLKRVADRLGEVVRSSDTVARLGGDEFVILLENITIAEAHCVAQKLLSTMEQPVPVCQRRIQCSLSIGLCAFSAESSSAHQILISADRALYQAKLIGKRTYCSFNKRLVDSMAYQQQLESIVHQAVQNGTFDVHYQLRQNATDGSIQGIAVHPVFPGQDVDTQDTGDIVALIANLGWTEQFSRMLIEKVLADNERLRVTVGSCPLIVSLAAHSAGLAGFCFWLLAQLESNKLDPARFCFEVRDALLLDANSSVVASLQAVQQAGCGIVLAELSGDLGAFRCLASAPINGIRIANDWVRKSAESARSAAIMTGVIDIAHKLGLEVQCMHGPEEPSALSPDIGDNVVRRIACGKPMTLEQLEKEHVSHLSNHSLRDTHLPVLQAT